MADSARAVLQGLLAMPVGQKAFYILAAITWLGGVVALSARSRRRVAVEGRDTFPRPRARFSRHEWFMLLLLAMVAMAFARIGLSFNAH